MLNQAAVFALIQQLGGSNNNIIYNAKFIDYCGGCHYSALLLAQLLYWSDKTRLEGGWIAKTKEEWRNELRLTPYKMRLAEARLRDELGILEIDVFKWNGFPTNHYRFKQEAFVASFIKFFEHGYSKILTNQETQKFSQTNVKNFEQPITDTTKQKLPTETTNARRGRPPRAVVVDEDLEAPAQASQARGGAQKKDKEVCPVFNDAKLSFEAVYLQRIGLPYRFAGGKDAAALKAILVYLRSISENKDWGTSLALFNAILAGWDSLPKWLHSNLDLSQINSQINAITRSIQQSVSTGGATISGADL